MKKNEIKNEILYFLESLTYFDIAFFIYMTLTVLIFPMLEIYDITNPIIDCFELIIHLIFIFYCLIKMVSSFISYWRK